MRMPLIAVIAMGVTMPAMAKDGPPPPERYATGRMPYDESVTSSNEYRGRWVGTWYGQDGRVYSGDYDGSYRGTVNGAEIYSGPTPQGHPHRSEYRSEAGNVYYAGPGVTTIIIQPATTTQTTTTYYEEVVVPARKKPWKARPKPQCKCK